MNEVLIDNWNKTVSDDDIVFHLGDFAFGGSGLWNSVISQLKGKIYLIYGNHDVKNLRQGFMDKFEIVTPQMQIVVDGQPIYLNHYPFLCYGGSYRNVWQLYGHVHSSPYNTGLDKSRLQYTFPMQYDVGVDNNNFTPVSYEQICNIINNQCKQEKT